jgi:hypothetical protein
MTHCPKHPEVELRHEYYTGYCYKCPGNHKLCLKTLYMERCSKLFGHEGKCCTKNGNEFDDNYHSVSPGDIYKKKVEVTW